jgi:hypothetical protein
MTKTIKDNTRSPMAAPLIAKAPGLIKLSFDLSQVPIFLKSFFMEK